MRALLLAAGIGSRLRPLTDTIPKCLVPIHGRPLLDYWLELVFAADIERVLINTHWLAPKVREFVAASPWKDRIDLVHEEELLGTGGTVWKNRDYLGGEDFLLAHADNLTDFDVAAMRRAHEGRPEHCVMTMLAFRTDDPRSCGILELGDDNVVQAFHEKVENPPGDLANGAVYIFTPDLIERLSHVKGPFIDLSIDVIPQMLGRILAFETAGYHRDIGNQESLRRAEIEFNPKP
jgi:mannose-1-phosphate guanylyltransferase